MWRIACSLHGVSWLHFYAYIGTICLIRYKDWTENEWEFLKKNFERPSESLKKYYSRLLYKVGMKSGSLEGNY